MFTRTTVHAGLLLSLAAAVGALPGRSSAEPRSAAKLAEGIVGTWVPVSQYVDQDGKRLEPFGAHPKGIVVYDARGRFVLVLQRETLPRFASDNRLTGTAEENQAIVRGSLAYFGTYTVDEKERKLHLHYEGSTFPNWDGQDQTRDVAIVGDELSVTSPVSAVGGGTVHLLLRRAR